MKIDIVKFVFDDSTHEYIVDGEFNLIGDFNEASKAVIELSNPIALPFSKGEVDLTLEVKGLKFECNELISLIDKELVFSISGTAA